MNAILRLVDAAELAPIEITDGEGRPRKQSDILVDLGRRHDLFHDQGGTAYARIGNRVFGIDSRDYREALTGEFYALTNKGPNRNAVGDACATLAAQAKFAGPCHHVWLRVGEDEGNVVIDCGDGRVVIVTPSGPLVAEDAPVRFRRTSGMLALPQIGKPNFSLLWNYVNVRPDHRPLIAGFLLAALRPRGPYPLLIFEGEQGVGKSTLTKFIRYLVDPSTSAVRAPPKEVRDLLVGALNGWLLALDNLSYLSAELSDALCRLATGGAISERALFTNTDEILIEVQRPAILNGIEDPATRPDLADRAIHIEVERASVERTEADLWRDFERDAPAIFAGLLGGLVASLRGHTTVQVGRLPRMADFATWASAGMTPLGFTADAFMAAYRANIASGQGAALESSTVGHAVVEFIRQRGDWSGTASALLGELARQVGESDIRSQHWPKSPRGLAGAIKRLAPALRTAGVDVTKDRDTGPDRERLIRLCSRRKQPSRSSASSGPVDGSDGSDGQNRALHSEADAYRRARDGDL